MTALRQRQPREHNAQHLKDMHALACLICGDDSGCDPAHIRFTAGPDKQNPGAGQKPHDYHVVPLCRRHHEQQHTKGGEREWWRKQGINPLPIAEKLWNARGDFQEMWAIMREFHRVHESMDEVPF